MPAKIYNQSYPQKQDLHKIIHDLNALAKTSDMTFRDCAKKIGITGRHFQRLRKGENLTFENVNAYANLFDVEIRCQLVKKDKWR